MKQNRPLVKLDSVESYEDLYGLNSIHPYISVIDLKKAVKVVNHIDMSYGVYALFLKNGVNCTLKYGRQTLDCQKGTIVSFAPGQNVSVDMDQDEVAPDVLGLLFHPRLFYGTPLGEKIEKYRFFDYSQTESLHLSDEEREIFLDCLSRIRREIEHPVDSHSNELIAGHVQLMLDYLDRFYDRQFSTRRPINMGIVNVFERALKDYYNGEKKRDRLPTVAYFAGIANLTPGYFGDVVKKATGVTAQEMIINHIVKIAKHRLATSSEDISGIAYNLGFQYPQHFTRLFKKMTNQSPSEFRKSII